MSFNVPLNSNDPSTGAVDRMLINFDEPNTLSEYAVFGDLTWHLTDRFSLQVGGRESRYRQTFNETISGPLTDAFYQQPSPYVAPSRTAEGNSFTYLLTPQFKIDRDVTVYGRVASGYRVGSFNFSASPTNGVPSSYAPDKTYNYEVGLKGDALEHSLSFDVSAYYIDWKGIQINITGRNNSDLNYTVNGGRAKSGGLEAALSARPVSGLTLTVSGALGDAALAENLPGGATVSGKSGDPLPYSSRFSGRVGADYDFLHVGNTTAFLGASVSYVGERLGEFTAANSRVVEPGYAAVNFNAGTRFESWLVNFYVNNATDRRGILWTLGEGNYVVVTQPRTLGLSVSRDF